MSIINSITLIFKILCVVSVTALSFCGGVWAQGSLPVPQIIVIDYQIVLKNSMAAKSLQNQLDIVNDRNEAELRPQANAVRNTDEKLETDRATLTDAQYAKGKAEVSRLIQAYQEEVKTRKLELEGRMNKTMVNVRRQLQQIAIELAKERGANMVLAKDAVIIMAPDFDVTSEVLKRLNENVPTVVLAD